MYGDPDLGEPIFKYGACAFRRRPLIPPSAGRSSFRDLRGQHQLYYSRASLNNVCGVTTYYEWGRGYCKGVKLRYGDGDEQVLGQCRDDLQQSEYTNPSYLSYKEVQDRVRIQFHLTLDQIRDEQEYYVYHMEGFLAWRFGYNYDCIEGKELRPFVHAEERIGGSDISEESSSSEDA
jgi:hypothetical protein